LMELGQALDATGRTEEAVAVLDQCLRLNPDHAGAMAERGRIPPVQRNVDKAEELLYRASPLPPGHGVAPDHHHPTLTQTAKAEEAAKEQESLRQMEADVSRIREILLGQLQETPNDPAVSYEIAVIALRAGRPNEALRWLQNALEVGPDHIPTHRAL